MIMAKLYNDFFFSNEKFFDDVMVTESFWDPSILQGKIIDREIPEGLLYVMIDKVLW